MKYAILVWLTLAAIGLQTCNEPVSDPEPKNNIVEEYDDVYQTRFQAYLESNLAGLSFYDPLNEVIGSDEYVPFTPATSANISPEAIESAIEYLENRRSTSFMIWHEGQLVARKYFGEQDPNGTINSRSLAKPIGVVAVGRAIKAGHIKSLDQPVSDFFTEWKSDERSKILVRHLLDMRTGLMMQSEGPDPNHIMNRAYLHPAHDQVIIDEYPLVNEPGTRYDYSNANAELVAPLLERATGVEYEDWVSDEVLKPIGAKGGQVWMNREDGTAHSGCCILLPPETFMRIAILYLQDGVWDGTRLLSKNFMEQISTATPQNPHSGMGVYLAGKYVVKRGPLNPDMNLGQQTHGEPYLADDLFLFDGNGNQVAYIIPSADMVIFRSGTWPPKELGWDNSMLPNLILAGTNFSEGQRPVPQK